MAGAVAARTHFWEYLDDMAQAGCEAVLRGATNPVRIRGAMIDELRRLAPGGNQRCGYRRRRLMSAFVVLEDVILAADTDVEAEVEALEEHEWLERVVPRLEGAERVVVERRLCGATLAQIGAELHVSESRVCQVLGAICRRLRELH